MNGQLLTLVLDDPNYFEAFTLNYVPRSLGTTGEVLQKGCTVYGRHWRDAQYVADQFWKHQVRVSFLHFGQEELEPERNIKVGDMVLNMDENMLRKIWLLRQVLKSFPRRDGLVWSVEVRMGDCCYQTYRSDFFNKADSS